MTDNHHHVLDKMLRFIIGESLEFFILISSICPSFVYHHRKESYHIQLINHNL